MSTTKTTFELLAEYFSGNFPSKAPEDLESKDDLKEFWKKEFEQDLESGINPLLAFQVLYHRLNEIASIAKEIFYQPALKYIKSQIGDKSTDTFFGTKVTVKRTENYEVVKNPKIQAFEAEKEELKKEHEDVINNYQRFQDSLKSIDKQINAEKENLVKQGMFTKKEIKESITLTY